ncbi:hypothetical protein QVD17_27321 [Tagetes erecta]|uniref:Cell differentiation protein rcd1 n=1 Tax=Tagetes erecta TaxID=13708 RepID=A0AAD8K894_TARER|nr:hypothetical protein QVD17_27321 [Tagetes erecta]
MENLPENLDIDPIEVWGGGADQSSERTRIEQCIELLNHPSCREEALALLNKERRCKDMPLLLWNAKNLSYVLLQEISRAYTMLSPPTLNMKDATRVCNALALLQSMASHPDTRMNVVRAKMPIYIYPFMNTTEKGVKHFDYLRLTSLGVIGALVKVEDTNSPEIIHFLLESEMFPLCLRCVEVGTELAKTVALFVISKILSTDQGKQYCGTFPERFFAVSRVLGNTIDEFPGKPSSHLLKHILTCFMRLSEVSRPREALTKCYPAKLRDPTYLNFACDDAAVRSLADRVLQNLSEQSAAGSSTSASY